MSRNISIIVLLLSVLSMASAQDEICSKPETYSEPLDLSRYAGRWYAALSLPARFSPSGTSCITANYDETDEFEGLLVRNTQVYPGGTYRELCGSVVTTDPEETPGELIVELGPWPANNYWILDTDYETFSAVYNCDVGEPVDNLGELAWVLVRDIDLDSEAVQRGLDAFEAQGIDTTAFEPSFQGDEAGCIYEPEEGPNCNED